MTNIDENLAPEPIPGVDFRSLNAQPTPEEFFLLSRLDGSLTVAQLCATSGLGRQKTMDCIKALREHGLIRFAGESTPATDAAPEPTASPGKEKATQKSAPDSDSEVEILKRFPVHFEDFQFDQDLLDQGVEMEDDFKKEVLFVYAQIDDVDYYQLLGTTKDAGRRQLRSAYFTMSKRYHPDRFFRKLLGDYEIMVEKIFQRITKAYQTLSNRKKRAEYDATLHRGRTSHATPIQASTPASRRSEPTEVIASERKREMAFQLLVKRGNEAMDDGNFVAAIREFRKALTLQRDADVALNVARQLMEDQDHLDDAIGFARAAQKIDPSSVDAWILMGHIYERKDQHDDALYHYRKALESSPDNQDVQNLVARLQDRA